MKITGPIILFSLLAFAFGLLLMIKDDVPKDDSLLLGSVIIMSVICVIVIAFIIRRDKKNQLKSI